MDPSAAKAQQHEIWRSVAPGWKRWASVVTRQTEPVTARLIAGFEPGDHVLDLASGVGDPAIAAAKKVAPGGSVLGTDQVEEMLAFAREEATAAGVTNLEFRVVDAERLDVPPASFDHVTMRFGLMFLPDPVGCLTRARAALKPGGSVRMAVWQGPEVNPWASAPVGVLRRYVPVPTPPPGAPGLFAMADRGRLESVFTAAGFADVRIEPLELVMLDAEHDDEGLRYLFDLAGPITRLYNQIPAASRPTVDAEIVGAIRAAGGGRLRLPGHVWTAQATKQ